MDAPPPTTYAFIPAPPLPEFYLPKKASSKNRSLSTSTAQALVKTKTKVQVSKQCQVQTAQSDEAVAIPSQTPAAPGDATDETMLGFTSGIPRSTREATYQVPPPPLGFGCDDIPPLAVYHICRICIRPRSARYHREHPIPINGVPPPPGICRRCRVTRIDEEIITETKVLKPKEKTRVVEVVTRGESNDIKIGVAAFVPDKAQVTSEEMKQRRGHSLLREAELQQRQRDISQDLGKERDITYRYVRVRETERTVVPGPTCDAAAIPLPPQKSPPPRTPTESSNSTAQDAMDAVSVRSPSVMMTTAAAAATSMQVHPTQMPSSRSVHSAASARVTEVAKSVSKQASASASSSTSTRSGTKASATAAAVVFNPERTDSEIRKIAREEVERYRQAERKLEAHPGAWAHGRMVPMQRRIELVSDSKEPPPWQSQRDHVKVHVEREKEIVRSPAPPSRQSEPGMRPPTSQRAWEMPEPQAEPIQRNPSTAKGWQMPDPQPEPSVSHSQDKEDREIIIERMVRRGSQAASSLQSSGTQLSRAQTQVEDAPDARSTVKSSRSIASDQTRWAPIAEEPQRATFPRPDPPRSAKVREVVSWDDERQIYVEERTAGSQADSRVSARVQELQEDAERKERAFMQSLPPEVRPASVRSSKPSEKQWGDEGAAKSASVRSSRYREAEVDLDIRYRREEEVRDEIERGPSALSRRTAPSQQSKRAESKPQASEPAEEIPKETGRVRAFDRRWAAARDAQEKQAAEWGIQLEPEGQRDEAGAKASRHSAPLEPSRITRSTKVPDRDYDREYIYTERTVQPAKEPGRRGPVDKRQSELRIDSEELWRFNVPDEDPPLKQTPQQKGRDGRKQQQQATKVSPSETSTRVRFANKVEYSPTPPGSDASSSQFRIIGPQGGKNGGRSGQVDGGVESAEDLIAEYERRGRARARDRDRAAPVENEETEKTYYYERDTWGPAESGDGAAEDRGDEEGWKKAGEVNDAAYRPRKSRPLSKALSESPSRERLSELFKEHQYKASGLSQVDGNGPYHPEQPRPESMDVLNGSTHPIPDWGAADGHGHGGWADEAVPAGGGGNAW
ncbi:hypothetical protein LTR08_002018 [Meristemomyces frigidus]|nr:hypothetical protein LTR08_002018 [Meristemomyces frigidus]